MRRAAGTLRRLAHGQNAVAPIRFVGPILQPPSSVDSWSFITMSWQCSAVSWRRSFGSDAIRGNRERRGLQPKVPKPRSVREAEGIEPTNKRFTNSIKLAAANKDWDACVEAFNACEQPNTIVFCAIMSAAMTCKQYKAGWEYFLKMGEAGIAKNSSVYSEALRLLGKMGNLDEVRKLWEHMKKHSPASCKYKPCATSYLDGFAAAGEVKEVEAGFASFQKAGLEHLPLYGCLLKAYKEVGDGKSALQVLDKIPQAGLRPSIVVCTTALMACVKEVETSRDFVAADAHKEKVLSCIEQFRLAIDKYFLEVHVAIVLRADLNNLGQIQHNLRNGWADAAEALRLVEQGTEQGMSTSSLNRVRRYL